MILFNLGVSALTGYFTPQFINDFYQSISHESEFKIHSRNLILLILFEYANRFSFQLATHRYIQKLLVHVRQKSYGLWLRAPFRKKGKKYEDYPMGEVLARLMNDTDAVREVVSSGGVSIFIDIIFITSCLISFLRLNSQTGIALFIAEIIACLLLIQGTKAMAKIFMEVRKMTGMMARVVTDITSGLRELFYSPNNKYASKRGEKIFEEFLDKQLHANVWDASYYSAAESLYPILIALVMIILPHSQLVEVAILAALIDLIQKSIGPIKEIASKISVIQRASTGLERITEFNESFVDEAILKKDFLQLDVKKLNLSLSHFQYDQGFALKNISFNLQQGETLGIVGESGSGKSTLLKLLSGQYHTFDGVISIDQKKIDTSSEHDLRDFCSYVSLISQDSHVFTEKLKFNITLGEDAGFEEFWINAKRNIPYLDRWQFSPEDKIDPKKLSMGQKQLVSGLRALFLKKAIILMDEISSGLDSDLEAALRDLIKFFQSRSITIIVTHRLETILKSNFLLLLEEGGLVASGTPEKLQSEEKFKQFLAHL
jgi:ATP-binding cassette subfamily B protein